MSKKRADIADIFDLEITDEDRERLSPEDLEILEEGYRKLKNDEYDVTDSYDKDKFSAEWMHPVGEPIPDWRGTSKDEKVKEPTEESTNAQKDEEKPKP